jgi:hypothetical protein
MFAVILTAVSSTCSLWTLWGELYTNLEESQRYPSSTYHNAWHRGSGASRVFVHLTGVGMLSTPGSAQRLLKESLRVLLARTGWPTLRKGLIMCMSELLNDCSPTMGLSIPAKKSIIHSTTTCVLLPAVGQ